MKYKKMTQSEYKKIKEALALTNNNRGKAKNYDDYKQQIKGFNQGRELPKKPTEPIVKGFEIITEMELLRNISKSLDRISGTLERIANH
jgi:hypothetical protein